MEIGIHSIPFEQYAAADGVSGSMLEVICSECPAKLKAIVDGRAVLETKPLTFGTWFHRFILEPDTLENAYYVQPDRVFVAKERLAKLKTNPILEDGMEVLDAKGYVALPWSGALTEAKAWQAAHGDRPLIPAADLEAIRGMVKSLRSNEDFMRLFPGGTSEQSLFVKDRGVLRKGRLDHLKAAGNYILDLKSCESANRFRFSKAIASYGYHRKAANYLALATLCGLRKEVFIFVAVEKTPPYISKCYRLDDDDLDDGAEDIEKALEVWRSCLASGIWPDYGPMEDIGLPQWKKKRNQDL